MFGFFKAFIVYSRMQVNTSNQFYNDINHILKLKQDALVVILSPHIDDAAWSLGPVLESLKSHGHHLQLINLFSTTLIMGDGMKGPARDTALRKAEETLATQEVGFDEVIYLDFPDGILRDRQLDNIFDPTYDMPAWLADLVLDTLKTYIPADAVVLAPSGFGWHIDHRLTAHVASKLTQRVIFYEDMPYAARDIRVQEAREFLQQQDAHPARIPVTPEIVEEHLRLYRLYISQRAKHHEEQISSYLAANGYGLWS